MGTTIRGIPYPEPTDPVYQGANDMRGMAEAVEDLVQSGMVQWTDDISPGGYADAIITFPAAFTRNPAVVANTTRWGVTISYTSISKTSATLRAFNARPSAITGGFNGVWLAAGQSGTSLTDQLTEAAQEAVEEYRDQPHPAPLPGPLNQDQQQDQEES